MEKASDLKKDDKRSDILLAEVYYLNNNFEKSKELFLKYKDETENPVIMNYLGLFKLDEGKNELLNAFGVDIHDLSPFNYFCLPAEAECPDGLRQFTVIL